MIIYQTKILRADLTNNPDAIYVFGDNMHRRGFGGQAKEMRGAANALGLITKWSPASQGYLKDSRYTEWYDAFTEDLSKLAVFLLAEKIVVFPSYGVGTGLARMEEKAPDCWRVMVRDLNKLGIQNPKVVS